MISTTYRVYHNYFLSPLQAHFNCCNIENKQFLLKNVYMTKGACFWYIRELYSSTQKWSVLEANIKPV